MLTVTRLRKSSLPVCSAEGSIRGRSTSWLKPFRNSGRKSSQPIQGNPDYQAWALPELAHELQRTESHLIFSIVYRRIKDELHCPVCTVHDSIIVAAEYASRAKQIFDDALKELQIPTFTEQEQMEALICDTFVADKTLT